MKIVSNSYLPEKSEWINLLFPLISLPFIFAEFQLGWAFSIAFFVAISHFGAIHHLITIYIVGQSPECGEWAKEHFGSVPKFFAAFTLLGLILFLMFVFSMEKMESQFPFMKWVFLSFILIDIYFISVFHMIHQSKGISLLYNKFGETSDNLKKWEKWERLCATGLVTGVVIAGFFGTFRRNPVNVSQYGFSRPLEILGLTLAALSALTYIYVAIKSSSLLKSSKGIFALRMIVWVFYPISMVAQATQRLVHGLEYYFIYAKIGKSRKDMITFFGILSAIVLIATYAVVLSFRRDGMTVYLANFGILEKGLTEQYIGGFKVRNLAYAFYGTFNVLHILIDSFLFRYKFPKARLVTLQHLLTRR
ncbi:hypothetical protein DOM21_17345 [Bacteriovorax stolpii]|uniref:hypothetical protein n=1 Tax=Bacteriovorax stolpii TaxID=960 RepID=UPI00105D0C15|nr:hypothetical protein [Bacteriovorax stolpii]QDK43188.1 hypothetical protein DOM21_17345 [Bacteriovorax stolpii]TDP53161.1 hypothetical protein C8D79_1803 [Bacteriovorax stolpii]